MLELGENKKRGGFQVRIKQKQREYFSVVGTSERKKIKLLSPEQSDGACNLNVQEAAA